MTYNKVISMLNDAIISLQKSFIEEDPEAKMEFNLQAQRKMLDIRLILQEQDLTK